jgi:hypothetical protein
MLPNVWNTDAFNVSARRVIIAVLIALPGLLGAATFAGAEAPSPVATEPASPPTPQATESAATTPTTTTTRAPSPSEELNTLLMHATFLIVGPTKESNKISFGTVFVMGLPFKNDPKLAHIVLVTAAHVFEGISGDNATLLLRRKNADGTYEAFGYQFPIRKDGRSLYIRHPSADVAAMYGNIPDEVPMTGLPPDALVTDKSLEEIEFHPGDESVRTANPSSFAWPALRRFQNVDLIADELMTIHRIDQKMARRCQKASAATALLHNSSSRIFRRCRDSLPRDEA